MVDGAIAHLSAPLRDFAGQALLAGGSPIVARVPTEWVRVGRSGGCTAGSVRGRAGSGPWPGGDVRLLQ